MSVVTYITSLVGKMTKRYRPQALSTHGTVAQDSLSSGWPGLTPAAAALLFEQDAKPEGAAYPSPRPSCTSGSLLSGSHPSGGGGMLLGLSAMSGRASQNAFVSARGSWRGAIERQKRVDDGKREDSLEERDALERFAVEYHKPVLPREIRSGLAPSSGRWFLDMTLGGAGHTEMLLENGACVVGIDRDREALSHASERLARFGRRFRGIHGSFADAVALMGSARGVDGNEDLPVHFEGVLMDLGVSSHQLDVAERE